MQRPAKGTEEALAYCDPLYNLARYLTGSTVEAEDLVQETFARAYGAWDSFAPGTNLKAWLFRILRNAHLDHRRRGRHRTEELDSDGTANEAWLLGDAELDGLRSIVADEIERALLALPEESRTVLLLDLEGLSEREVADVVGCALGTVKSRLSRARAALRLRLRDYQAR